MNETYIYLVFSKTGSWLSRGITIFSDTQYIHTSISLDSSFSQMYSFGRRKPNNLFIGGFVKESFQDGIYKKFPTSQCLIYRVKVTKKQYEALEREINNFLKEKDYYKYNFLGLFGVLFNKPFKRKYHYFCTQFVSEVLIKSNIYYSEKVPELIRSSDLFNLENKELIYSGPITAYPLSYKYAPHVEENIEQVI